MNTPTRPVMRWHGGKWKLAPWIISHFPPHRIYVEPFGGAASVLMRKPRCYAEVYNDLDGDAVNIFRVLRDEVSSKKLIDQVRLTPFSRDEFELAYAYADCPVEAARRLLILCFMGYGSNGHNRSIRTGFRANSNRSGSTPAHDWANYPDCMTAIIDRLRGVIIENRDALEVMAQHDDVDTLHYVDPPYVFETRTSMAARGRAYKHELNDDGHARLLKYLGTLKGMVVLSGYPHPSYDAALPGWLRVECKALADGARERTEALWINRAGAEAARRGCAPGLNLFSACGVSHET
ncbi:MAG TPA: DNA adenine methylase [Alphaproteobacteria bacterium]|nr:DNA adenine methylase [Alphaproteobacteria bacterium]